MNENSQTIYETIAKLKELRDEVANSDEQYELAVFTVLAHVEDENVGGDLISTGISAGPNYILTTMVADFLSEFDTHHRHNVARIIFQSQ